MEFSRQEYWSELPFPPPGDLPDPGIEPASPMSPVLQVDSLPLSHQGNSKHLVLWLLLDTNKINTIDWVNAVAALPYCFSTSFPHPQTLMRYNEYITWCELSMFIWYTYCCNMITTVVLVNTLLCAMLISFLWCEHLQFTLLSAFKYTTCCCCCC